jgi:hypothetical protein
MQIDRFVDRKRLNGWRFRGKEFNASIVVLGVPARERSGDKAERKERGR